VNLDKLYDQILARKESRESSTLTINTLASSASLILFVFFLNSDPQLIHRNLIIVLGILFPLVAIGFREINFYYIQAHDNTLLNAILFHDFDGTDKEKEEIKNAIQYKQSRRTKTFLLRFLVMIPVFGWVMVNDYFVGIIINIVLVLLIIAFTIKIKFGEPKNDIPSFLKDHI